MFQSFHNSSFLDLFFKESLRYRNVLPFPTFATPIGAAMSIQATAPYRHLSYPQIGIRGAQNSHEGWEYSEKHGMRVMFVEEVQKVGIDAVVREARDLVGDMPVYLSFDIDSPDPVFAPGTGTPEIGGLTTPEALALVRGFSGLSYVGADVVEVSPPFDVGGLTSLTAATIMYEILCNMSEVCAARNKATPG
ncbi:hypothetical protein EYC08_21095 [Tabrizicola sp. WMC-M-20]|nr:hypothetical protein EYC08_21095 [Tabrizicola sp. WMC-M-20]